MHSTQSKFCLEIVCKRSKIDGRMFLYWKKNPWVIAGLPMRFFILSLTICHAHFLQAFGMPMILQEMTQSQVEFQCVDGGVIDIRTVGDDPWISFTPAAGSAIPEDALVFAFEYFCPDGVDDLEIHYSRDIQQGWSAARVVRAGILPRAEAWQPFAVNMRTGSNGDWNPAQAAIRLDTGRRAGVRLRIRNVHFRIPTAEELAGEAEIRAAREVKEALAARIDSYWTREYDCASIEAVRVTPVSVVLKGELAVDVEAVIIFGYEPHENVWEPGSGSRVNPSTKEIVPVSANRQRFEVTLPRFAAGRDRIAWRWALAGEVAGEQSLLTPAVWATDITAAAERDMPRLRPSNRKGLGGVSWKQDIVDDDLQDLGMTAATINMDLSGLFEDGGERIQHTHQGRAWDFSAAKVREWDHIIREMTRRNIVVSSVLLISPGRPELLHPDYHMSGIYSMANLTAQDPSDTYRAVISFLAERYSRPTKEHGWITHWIIFNEIDYGWTWTNMGEHPMSSYMDLYEKVMRVTWLEAGRFNPTVEVFISLTHHWDYEPLDSMRTYAPRRLLDRLALACRVAGDFPWGVAAHPYPQSLFNPRTWEDSDSIFAFDTPRITIRNIEVLDAYLRQEQFLNLGSARTVLLSEQGFHTPDYTEPAMLDKAAAIAYAWQKIRSLAIIESFHYHRWVDHPNEGGLRLGLRTLPSPGHPNGERKQPAFSVLSALETSREAEVIAPLKQHIGIRDWSEVSVPASRIVK